MEKETILARAIAKQDADKIQGTSIGYSLSYIMDYGNGRQVTIAGCLPIGAEQSLFDSELDKLRLATNRQQAFVILRDRESRLAAEKKMCAAIEHMIKTYTTDADAEMAKLSSGETGKHTLTKQQVTNMRMQVNNYTQTKKEELQRHQAEVEICEVIIAGCKKEIEG